MDGHPWVLNSHISDLEFVKNNNIINIGALRTNRKYNRHKYIREDIYITLKVPFVFQEQIDIEKRKMKNLNKHINNSDVFISKYKNIPFIFCDNKTYVEKIMNEEVQKEIAKLISKISSEFTIKFCENKISLVIFNLKWSTNFSRIFSKNKNLKDIFEFIDIVAKSLANIAMKIEKDEL